MRTTTAKEVANFLGWIILAASLTQIPMMLLGGELLSFAGGRWLFYVSWAVFALATGTGIALIQRATLGFYLLYVAMFLCFFGPHFNFLPLIRRVAPAGPEMDYWFMGANLAVALLAAFAHWSIAREARDPRGKWIPILFIALLIPGAIYWKAGLTTLNADLASVQDLPLIGDKLQPLKTMRPLAARAFVESRHASGRLAFSGSTTEANLREFATAHELKQMTNASARVKFLPILKTWKLSPERFPKYAGETDLCYIGRIPKGSKNVIEICFRPGEGRFTAMSWVLPSESAPSLSRK